MLTDFDRHWRAVSLIN